MSVAGQFVIQHGPVYDKTRQNRNHCVHGAAGIHHHARRNHAASNCAAGLIVSSQDHLAGPAQAQSGSYVLPHPSYSGSGADWFRQFVL